MKLPDRQKNLRKLTDDVLDMTDWGLQQLHDQATRRPEITDIVEMHQDHLNALRAEAQSWTKPDAKVTTYDLVRVMHQSTEVLLQVIAEIRAHDPGIGPGTMHQAVRAVHWLTVEGRLHRFVGLYFPLSVGAVAGATAATVVGKLRRGGRP